jgi:hypothetical protein
MDLENPALFLAAGYLLVNCCIDAATITNNNDI